jgi:hypothetical protein
MGHCDVISMPLRPSMISLLQKGTAKWVKGRKEEQEGGRERGRREGWKEGMHSIF